MTMPPQMRRNVVARVAEAMSAHARSAHDALPRWHWRRLTIRRRNLGPMAFVPGARTVVAALFEHGYFDDQETR